MLTSILRYYTSVPYSGAECQEQRVESQAIKHPVADSALQTIKKTEINERKSVEYCALSNRAEARITE